MKRGRGGIAAAVMMAAGLGLGVGQAQAASSVALRLEAPSRYRAEVLVQTGAPVQLLASNNLNARATMIAMALEMSCAGQVAGKGWTLRCDIDTAQLQGTALSPQEQERLDAILAEFGTLMGDAYAQVVVGSDGRIRLVDIEGVDKRDERMSVVHEYIRLLVRRAFAATDVQLPKKGQVSVGDRWKHKGGSLTMEVFSRFGTIGGSVVEYEALSTPAGAVVLQREGRGNIGVSNAGSTIGFEDGSQATTTGGLYNSTSIGLLRLNATETGNTWLYGEYSTQGTLNQATSSLVDQFTLAGWIGRINADGTVEGPEGPRRLEE